VLSNAFMYAQGKEAEFDSLLDSLQAVLSSIPEELFHEIELEVHNAEGAATNKQRLEVLKEQQELIQEENEQAEQQGGRQAQSVSDREDIDEKEEEDRQQAALAKGDKEGADAVTSEKTAATGEDEDAKLMTDEAKKDGDDVGKKAAGATETKQ
ncbi:hypothetical protein KC316_g11930, partial [Hortaea werneckii]